MVRRLINIFLSVNVILNRKVIKTKHDLSRFNVRVRELITKYLSRIIHRFKNVTNGYVETKCNNNSPTF